MMEVLIKISNALDVVDASIAIKQAAIRQGLALETVMTSACIDEGWAFSTAGMSSEEHDKRLQEIKAQGTII